MFDCSLGSRAAKKNRLLRCHVRMTEKVLCSRPRLGPSLQQCDSALWCACHIKQVQTTQTSPNVVRTCDFGELRSQATTPPTKGLNSNTEDYKYRVAEASSGKTRGAQKFQVEVKDSIVGISPVSPPVSLQFSGRGVSSPARSPVRVSEVCASGSHLRQLCESRSSPRFTESTTVMMCTECNESGKQ